MSYENRYVSKLRHSSLPSYLFSCSFLQMYNVVFVLEFYVSIVLFFHFLCERSLWNKCYSMLSWASPNWSSPRQLTAVFIQKPSAKWYAYPFLWSTLHLSLLHIGGPSSGSCTLIWGSYEAWSQLLSSLWDCLSIWGLGCNYTECQLMLLPVLLPLFFPSFIPQAFSYTLLHT
jgi:hypothetical protein